MRPESCPSPAFHPRGTLLAHTGTAVASPPHPDSHSSAPLVVGASVTSPAQDQSLVSAGKLAPTPRFTPASPHMLSRLREDSSDHRAFAAKLAVA